jgi:hypothetical protein
MGTNDPWLGTAWDDDSPDDGQPAGNAFKEIYDLRKGIALRMNKEHTTLATSSAGGVHKQGSARAFFQDAAPTTQVNGDALAATDLGLFWVDSNSAIDNELSILTATTPTWTPISVNIIATLLASARTFGDALTVTGLLTANGGVTLGAGDDLIGSATSDITINTNKFTVAGATGNTSVGGTFESVGVATLADESVTKTTAAPSADAQIANKKYVDDQITAAKALSAWTTQDADSAAMVDDGTTYTATSDGFLQVYGTKTPVSELKITVVCGGVTTVLRSLSDAASTDNHVSGQFSVASGDTFTVTDNTGGVTTVINWRSIGTLSKPTK